MLDILWPAQDQYLALDEVIATAADLKLCISATAPSAACPVCQVPSTHRHSHYQRSLFDLPIACHTRRLP